MASTSTPSVNEPTRVVHTEKLKPMIKGPISGKLVFSGISHIAFASVYSEKTRMKKLMIMIIIIKGNVVVANLFSKKYGNKG